MSRNDPPFSRDDPDWRVVRALRDGTRVVLRGLGPSDKDALRAAFSELSLETRYMRFFSVVTEPSEPVLRYLTSVDQEDHVAIVAVVESLDLKEERGAGIARFVRVAGDSDVAEAAVTVTDAYQRKGLGTILLAELTRAALARDVRVFRGEVLASNEGMLQILESVGAKVDPVEVPDFDLSDVDPTALARDLHPAARRFEVELDHESTHMGQAIFHAFRAAARSMATELRSMFGTATSTEQRRTPDTTRATGDPPAKH